MTSHKITVRGIFNETGELVRILHQNGGGKSYFMDVEPSNDASIDDFFMDLVPPQTETPTQSDPLKTNPDAL
jgi:hypothetical protein